MSETTVKRILFFVHFSMLYVVCMYLNLLINSFVVLFNFIFTLTQNYLLNIWKSEFFSWWWHLTAFAKNKDSNQNLQSLSLFSHRFVSDSKNTAYQERDVSYTTDLDHFSRGNLGLFIVVPSHGLYFWQELTKNQNFTTYIPFPLQICIW